MNPPVLPPRLLGDWLAWIETLHPRSIELGLDRVRCVAHAMGVTSLPCVVVTVAGTNGKGSSVAMLEAAFAAGGYRTAAYTSPHLLRYNERVRIDGVDASDDALCAAFERVEQARGDVSLSYFEFGTLAALDLITRARPDVALLEVGMGGRLDAVNIIDPDVAMVTSIGRDHMEWLGNTREEIAREKAGIFRAGVPAVCGDADPPQSLLDAARAVGAPLYLRGRDYGCVIDDRAERCWHGPRGARLALRPLALAGEFQYENAASVLMVLDLLADRLPSSPARLAGGLATARNPGRFQHLPADARGVQRVVDVAHNADGARALAAALAASPCAGVTRLVFGVLGDKDVDAMVSAMAAVAEDWYLAAPKAARAAAPGRVSARVRALIARANVRDCADVAAAWEQALDEALPGDRVVGFGSFYTVGEILAREQATGARV
ncbi:MAG: bifunctional tetrahydrofolate synthase/dihydrofolate synthase [Chromatiales bacterium]|nr:bifunctional tetrahydrofolate synthase/dihydrofolate synthase [Chromatiales bacterium]